MSEKIEQFWRDATAFDVVQVMAGETVEARFRDVETEPWTTPRALGGWSNQGWVSGLTWNHCQVYREPSWWTDKPDPGPGWRLLGKFPDEPRQPKDDVFVDGTWRTTEGCGPQPETLWYRRRIEQPKPEPKHYVLAVGDTVETPRGHLIEVASPSAEQWIYSLNSGDILNLPNGQTITITEKGFEVTQ